MTYRGRFLGGGLFILTVPLIEFFGRTGRGFFLTALSYALLSGVSVALYSKHVWAPPVAGPFSRPPSCAG